MLIFNERLIFYSSLPIIRGFHDAMACRFTCWFEYTQTLPRKHFPIAEELFRALSVLINLIQKQFPSTSHIIDPRDH